MFIQCFSFVLSKAVFFFYYPRDCLCVHSTYYQMKYIAKTNSIPSVNKCVFHLYEWFDFEFVHIYSQIWNAFKCYLMMLSMQKKQKIQNDCSVMVDLLYCEEGNHSNMINMKKLICIFLVSINILYWNIRLKCYKYKNWLNIVSVVVVVHSSWFCYQHL